MMSSGPQNCERKTSILVPAVLRVLMKMNLWRCETIIGPLAASRPGIFSAPGSARAVWAAAKIAGRAA
jgi:hypothetical protein